MELLAPAGTMENFMAALESGADAIYLGGKGFNARAHAANFGIEELAEAIRLAHILDVSVYVTVNNGSRGVFKGLRTNWCGCYYCSRLSSC